MKKVTVEEYNLILNELECFANEISEEVSSRVKYNLKKPHEIIKIPVMIRCKEYNSFYEKAYFRDKKYKNPVIDITDKVGIRFVVLLPKHIKKIKSIILNYTKWEARVDRDIDRQIGDNPYNFDYLSTHIVLKRKNDLKFSADPITCEVQIRTLTQHAYAELTHDLVYKAPVNVSIPVKRNVGRCMALIDTTDQIFGDTSSKIDKDIHAFNQKLNESTKFCKKHSLDISLVKKINSQIYYNLIAIIKELNLNRLEEDEVFMHKLRLIYAIDNIYFKQPLSVFLVAAAVKNATFLIDNWQIDDDIKNLLFKNVGVSKVTH